jgi:hypothetical protein
MVGSDQVHHEPADAERLRFLEGWRLSETPPSEPADEQPSAEPNEAAALPKASAYDVDQWRKKLKRVLDKLPASQSEWEPMIADGRALGLDTEWMAWVQLEEFTLLIRRAIADRRFTSEEHRKLDLARDLIGMTEPEAEALVQSVVAEAEAFFGKPVQGA